MPRSPAKSSAPAPRPMRERVQSVLFELESLGSPKKRTDMAGRFGIHTDKAWGVGMAEMQKVAKRAGRDHALAAALWKTGWYEARMVACLVDDPHQVTPEQMDAWCEDFDNWAICDTACFKLFDTVPFAFDAIRRWTVRPEEFVRRAGFSLLACVTPADDLAAEKEFARFLPVIAEYATDARNFVKKAVNWALRSVGGRSQALHAAAVNLAQRLAESPDKTARWVGRDALKQLGTAATLRRVERNERRIKRSPGGRGASR